MKVDDVSNDIVTGKAGGGATVPLTFGLLENTQKIFVRQLLSRNAKLRVNLPILCKFKTFCSKFASVSVGKLQLPALATFLTHDAAGCEINRLKDKLTGSGHLQMH